MAQGVLRISPGCELLSEIWYELRHGFAKGLTLREALAEARPTLGPLLKRYGLAEQTSYQEYDGQWARYANSSRFLSFDYQSFRLHVEVVDATKPHPRLARFGFIELVIEKMGEGVALKLASPVHRSRLAERVRDYLEVIDEVAGDILAGGPSARGLINPDDTWRRLHSRTPLR